MSEKRILISEIFGPVVQGEGALIGRPTIFVRTGGCDYRCSWCDSLYAVLPEHKSEWTPMRAREILDRVLQLSNNQPILVTLSGGNPALAPLEPLIDLGIERGFSFALETQASMTKSWFGKLAYLVLSPKGPSSGMKTDWTKLQECRAAAGAQTKCNLKVVVFDEADYLFARAAAAHLPQTPVYLQVGTPVEVEATNENIAERTSWLLNRCIQDGWNQVAILPQLHVLLWGRGRGI